MSAPVFDIAPNVAPNPGFESTSNVASTYSGSAPAGLRDTGLPRTGSYSYKLTANADGLTTMMGAGNAGVPVTGGATYSVSGWSRAAATSRQAACAVSWYDSSASFISSQTGSAVGTSASAWTQATGTFTAPANAVTATLFVRVSGALAASEVHYFDDLSVRDAALLGRPLSEAVRLEIEDDPSGLVNEVENPSGVLGGWGWVTPVAASKLEGANDSLTEYKQGLKYSNTTANAGGQYFHCERFDCSPGEWVGAFWHVNYTPWGYHRARVEWLDSSGAQIAASAWASFDSSNSDCNLLPVQAPAGTVYARFLVELGKGSGVYPNNLSSQVFSIRSATVAKASTAGELATTLRTNYVTNPSFEVDTAGWSVMKNCTIARTTSKSQSGAASLQITASPTAAVAKVTQKSLTSNVATLTLEAPHYFRQSEPITVAGVDSTFNGSYTVTAHTANTVSYAKTAANVTTTSATGTVTSAGNPGTPVSSWTVTNKAATSGTATLTVSASTMQARRDMSITVSGVGAPFDGTWLVTSSESNKVSFNLPAGTPDVASAASSGNVARDTPNDIVEMVVTSGDMAITGGLPHTLSFKSQAGSAAREMRGGLSWTSTPGGTEYLPFPAVPVGAQVSNSTSSWPLASYTRTLGIGGLTYARAHLVIRAKAGEVHYVDSVLLEQASSAGAYFDGDTPDTAPTVIYSWSGTPHASVSTYTDSLLENVTSAPYVNVLGEATDVACTREELNVGSMQATVASPALDPAVADVLDPGRQFRLTAFNPLTGAQEPLVSGKLLNARAEYYPANPASQSVVVTASGTDAVTQLANSRRPDAVAAVADLPWVLEGCGVPWNVNGSGAQVSSATIAATNDNASALDQVALARDTELGFAWLDRFSVLQAWSTLPSTVDWYLDETVYNRSIKVDYDSDRLVNSVVVRRQWNHPTEGPKEDVYGPYNDSASVEVRGVHQKEFTVAGMAPGSIPAYAAEILAANSTPQKLIRSVTIPITGTEALKYAFVELYDLCQVTSGSLVQQSRVTRVSHKLEATPDGGRWLVELEFASDGGVASPTVQPPVQGATIDVSDGTWITVGDPGAPAFQNSWVAYDAAGTGWAQPAFMRKNGVVHLKGMIKSGTDAVAMFTLPAGYRPAENHIFACTGIVVNETTGAASAGTAHTHPVPMGQVSYRVDILSDGTVKKQMSTGANGWVSLSGVNFVAEQ